MSLKEVVREICRADKDLKEVAYYLSEKFNYKIVRFAKHEEPMDFVCENSTGGLLSIGVVTAYSSTKTNEVFIPSTHNGNSVGFGPLHCRYVVLKVMRNESCLYFTAPLATYKSLILGKRYQRLAHVSGPNGEYTDYVFSLACIAEISLKLKEVVY